MNKTNWECAFVGHQKLADYLLNENHPVGGSKAKYFRGHGFNENTIAELMQGLVYLAQTNRVLKTEQTKFGIKYTIDGALNAPSGAILQVRTAWIVDNGEECPRFVTGYPA